MMYDPQSQSFDPDRVLQLVWQSDYPNTWRVFYGSETITNIYTVFLVFLVLALVLAIYVVGGISYQCATGNCFSGDFNQFLWWSFFIIAFLGVLIFLTIRSLVKERRANKKLSQQPNPTLVVLPDRVVTYRRQLTRSLNFAEVAYMRLRVQANTETVTTKTSSTSTVPAPPSIWLDLSFYDGRRDAWSIDINPQDMIAQCILDAYNTYQVTKER
jgi:hypothetical protein